MSKSGCPGCEVGGHHDDDCNYYPKRRTAMSNEDSTENMTDDEIMRIFQSCEPTEEQFSALTVTRWKDGIDVDFPAVTLRQLFNYFQAELDLRVAEAARKAEEKGRDEEFDSNCEYLMEPFCNLADARGRDVDNFDTDGTPISIIHDAINEFAQTLKPMKITYDNADGEYRCGNVAEAEERQRWMCAAAYMNYQPGHGLNNDRKKAGIFNAILNAGGNGDE